MTVLAIRMIVLALAATALSGCGGGDEASGARDAPSIFFADSPQPATSSSEAASVEPVDYAPGAAWLCLPGRDDACGADASSTIVAADGSLTIEPFLADPEAPIDCFYIYPTVSEDAAANSDIVAGDGERNAALNQVARFSQACRVFAPMYRQVTLSALRAMLAGGESVTNREMAYADVRAAWRHYLEAHNDGRGVVLIGHSQGAGILARLIASEISNAPAREQIVSAILLGTNLEVDPARPGDGAIGGLPLCSGAVKSGCVIAYASFRSDRPASSGSLFGAATQRGRRIACVNPAMLDGSNGLLRALLPLGKAFESTAEPPQWSLLDEPIETPLVALPGMLSAQCVTRDGYTFLSVTVRGDPDDMRADDIVGDVVLNGEVQPGWGLHVIDVNLTLGNLVDVVAAQSLDWRAAHAPIDVDDSGSSSETAGQPG